MADLDRNGSDRNPPPTTTISTIAVQSGNTKIVIALLQSREWLELKVVELTPLLTLLGSTLQEASELQKAHDEVLLKIQSKQSPVEELLSQADQLIANQKNKGQVYVAMADSLAAAWKDINNLLQKRKEILNLNVRYHSNATMCLERTRALELACRGAPLPVEVPSIKELLARLSEVKRAMLESLMTTLQDGRALVDMLRETALEGTLDSRPAQIKSVTECAISQVEHWMEELHDRRRLLELSWQERKTQLEQCLALALLTADLKILEEIISDRSESLSRSNDQLGDSEASSQLLLYEHKKLLPEAKDFQEQALKILSATEHFSATGHFAGDEATAQAYRLLNNTSEYLEAIENRSNILEMTITFFRSAQIALTKLDQIEVQLLVSDLPTSSTQLTSYHSSLSQSIEEITEVPIEEGYKLLTSVPGAEGVKRILDEIENRKLQLSLKSTAHKEDNIQLIQSLNSFNESQKQLCLWLENSADTFLQGHQDMGSVLVMAKDFLQIHLQFLSDLQIKGTEINSLISVLPPVINTLDESVRIDIESKVENLRSHWKKLKQYVEKRTELATAYVKFHTLAVDLANIFDNLESEMKKVNQEETLVRQTEEQWHEAQQVFVQLNNVGNNFREDTKNVGEPYLDAERARLCVDTLLEHFGDRKLSLESCWKAWENNLARQKACRVQWEVNMTETTQTVGWITKLDAELYPVLSEDEHVLGVILHDVENKLSSVLPEIKRAQTEIHCRIATAESLVTHGEVVANDEEILMQLRNLEQHVQSVGTNYQILIEMLIAFFKNLIQLERTIDSLKKQYGKMEFPSTVADVEKALREHDASRQAIQELFKFTHVESQQIIEKIKQQEPELAMEKDVNVLRGLLEDKRCDWERAWSDHKINLEQHLQLCHFDADLAQIHNNFDELDKQLAAVKGQYGESLGANKSTSIAFTYFEKTVEILRQRIETFINAGEVMLKSKHASSIHIEEGLHSIHKRWEEFSSHVSHTRNLIDISIQYFTLIEEAEEWFKECSRLLVGIARRSASVHKPEEATHLLEELENFFKSGEIKQDERITKISELATKLYGVHDSSELHQVKSERKEMFESFSQVSRELKTLVGTLNRPSEPVKMEIDDIKSTNNKMHTVSTTETVSSSVQEKIIIIHEDSLPQTSSTFEERVLKSPSPPAKKAKFQSESKEQKAPFFTVPLADAIIEEGNKLIFECKVAGVPTPQISWMKDGISIDNNLDYHTLFNDGICSLTIEETFAEDSATFTCHAINEAGFAETTATLSVRECEGETPPSFVIPLRPAKVKERSQFAFMCRVAGNPLPTVQWCKDTTCIDNSSDYVITYNNGEAVLKFDEITLNDQAEYFCKATNRLGTESTSAMLTVEGKEKIEVPVFTVPLSNIMARAGQKIKLECEVHGTPEPQITWLHNGKIIKETRDLKISYDQHNAVLVITEAFPKDAGTYEVKAVNCAGENVSTCHVSVKGRLPTETSDSEIASDMEPCKPVIQVSLKDLTVFEGMKARLDCVIVGQPEPEVIWYLENRPVKESGDFQLLFHGDRCSLIIKEAYIEDAGEYKVVAINSAGEASSSCRLTVQSNTSEVSTKQSAEESQKPETELSKPHFTMLLSDVLVTEGDTVHLKCIVKGEPVPSVTWCLNNIDIVCSDRIQCKQESNGTCSLTINHVLPSDKGVYTAKAINSVGEAKCFSQLIVKLSINTENTNPIDVHVAERKPVSPIFTELFADRTVTEGTTTKFECVVTAKPTPKIHWLFNEKPVSGKDFLISTSGPRQVLTIQNVMKSHAGRIACVAENEAGKATCLATLSVRDAPVDSLLPSLASIDLSETTSFEMKRSVFMKSVTQSEVVTAGNGKEPTIQIHGLSSCTEQAMQRIGDSPSAQVQIHKTREYHNVGGVEDKVDQQFQTSNIPISEVKLPTKDISRRKEVAPRFITPIMGKIVNQHEDVILEATIESYPTAEIKWTKNERQLCMTDNAAQSWELNRARLEIKNIRLEDAGKYTCTASSTVGTASSTADVVVKKSVFPPVIGKRLQSSIHEVGQRVVLEVEITGIPEPTVTWYKDEQQIASKSSEYRVLNQGSSYSLIINEAGHAHSGKYCVKATNCGGEALSTADLVIVEPQQTTLKHLETMELTVTPQPLVKSKPLLTADAHEFSLSSDKSVLSSNITKVDKTVSVHLEQSSHTYQQLSDISLTYPQQRTEISVTPSAGLESYIEPIAKQESFTESISKKELYTEPVANNESRTETTEQKETVTNKDTYVKPFVMKDSLVTQFSNEDTLKESKEYKESNIEDSSITKKHALEYFKNIIKENDEEKLTSKQFEKSTSKTAFNIQDCQLTPQTHLTSLPSENSITNSTYQPDYKYQVNEDIFNKQQAENRSSVEKNIFDLQPEPPPEIGYIPKTLSKPKEDLAERVKKLEDSHRTLSAVEIPSGAVKIFPTLVKKESESAVIYENAVSTNNNDSGIREIRDIFSSNENSKDHYTHFSQKLDAATNFPKEVSISDISALRDKQSILEDTESGVQWTSHETYKSLKCLDTSDITSVKTIPIFSQSDISCENKQKTPLPPSAEGVAMEKLWSRTIEHPRSHSVNLPVARSTSPMPSAEGVAMDKLWGHKQSNIKRIWPPPKPAEEKNLAPWVIKPSSEISWPPSQIQQASISQGGIAKSTENTVLASNKSFVHFTKEVEISEMKKVFPPEQNRETVILSQPKPLSKEDTKFEDFNLEPGPPPEIGYARPPLERRQSLVETIEQDLEKDLDKAPSRHLVGAVRIMPPPPKKKEKSSDQVVPQKYSESKFTEFKTHSLKESKIESILQSFQKCSNVQSVTICKSKSTLPPRPSKFIKGSFTESDYESDYESSKIASKWAAIHTSRPHSVIGHDDKVPESPAPSAVFLKPVSCSLQSTKESVQTNINIKTEEYFSRTSKHSQITAAATVLKPGSPPEFIQPTPLTKSIEGTEKVKPGSPKSKSKISCESGYMADTDEPQTLHKEEKTLTKSEDSRIATMQHGLIKTEKKNLTGKALAGHPVIRSSFKKETTSQQKINQDCAETQLTSFPFKPEGLFQTKRHLGPPPPSPSKFIKGEFRESDYESDYESRIPPIWRPYESDTELTFRPVRPLLTPVSGRSQNIGRTPTPPTEFDEPPQFSGPPRPKFEPIEKPLPTVKIDAQSQRSLKVIRPKPLPAQTSPIETIIATPAIKHDSDIILKPGSPPKIDFAPSLSSVSYRVPGGTQLETSNTMSFAESTGSSRRIVSMQQTTRVIKFEDKHDKKVVKQSEWQKRENAPTPTKFVAGKARESDYESDFEGTKIKPVWVPESSMKNSLQVQAEQRRLQRVDEMRKRFGETTTEMKCMSEDSNEPCQFGTSSGGTSQVANYAASKHFSEMTHSFKSKAQQFASDLMTDVKSNKDTVENKALQKEGMLNGNDPQSYREESKVSEYEKLVFDFLLICFCTGTKHIDPDTGLIYFKYDFGYEFGVILPGEEKSNKKKSQVLDKKEEGNIDFPVIHEKTVPKKSSREMKTVKWEQTSESEMSDIEGESRRKRQIQHEPHISVQLGTPSPQSLSPSIQSLSPYSAGYDSTVSPHVSWKDISSPPPVSQMPVTAAGFDSVHKPPFFITPLRDIACVIGQPARFECIVQAEPVPDIMWSKDKHMLHPSPQYTTEYRNGVCRLSLHQTMPYDAGKYMCTATNIVGIAVTESTLQVAGERRSVCK